ncbi:MAG: HEPN domain-containing protein [Chloroflexi bacterium]|nr:HEPN domain-containing protein [Chloroflexota bacterium]
MPPKRYPPNDPREWLNRAKSNLARAKGAISIPEVYLEDLCFDAQQAAEKATKALLISLRVRFPRTHDLTELVTLVEQAGQAVPQVIKRAGSLTPYAVVARYPGVAAPVTQPEYAEAVAIAEAVVQWVEEQLSQAP